MDHLFFGVWSQGIEPLDQADGGLEFIVIRDREKYRHVRRIAQVSSSAEIRVPGHQHQRPYFRMAAGGLYRIIYSATRTAYSDGVACNPWLSAEVLKCHVDVAGPQLRRYLARLAGRQFVLRFTATFAEAAQIEGKDIDSSRCKLLGQAVPYFSLTVALM